MSEELYISVLEGGGLSLKGSQLEPSLSQRLIWELLV